MSFQRDDCIRVVRPGLPRPDRAARPSPRPPVRCTWRRAASSTTRSIIFTSDHGEFLGDHWLGEKELFYDAVQKVPLRDRRSAPRGGLDARPRRVRASSSRWTSCRPCSTALGVAAPGHRLEGMSLLLLLHGDDIDGWRDFAYSELDYSYRIARLTLGKHVHQCRAYSLRTSRWRYVYWLDEPEQLFDLDADPHEFNDLGRDASTATVRAGLRDRLLDFLARRRHRSTVTDESVERGTGCLQEGGRVLRPVVVRVAARRWPRSADRSGQARRPLVVARLKARHGRPIRRAVLRHRSSDVASAFRAACGAAVLPAGHRARGLPRRSAVDVLAEQPADLRAAVPAGGRSAARGRRSVARPGADGRRRGRRLDRPARAGADPQRAVPAGRGAQRGAAGARATGPLSGAGVVDPAARPADGRRPGARTGAVGALRFRAALLRPLRHAGDAGAHRQPLSFTAAARRTEGSGAAAFRPASAPKSVPRSARSTGPAAPAAGRCGESVNAARSCSTLLQTMPMPGSCRSVQHVRVRRRGARCSASVAARTAGSSFHAMLRVRAV
ncbi:MAG: hypothetical protein MZV65_32945 [Chromatiales bacterium]|nr:hypothetical protein [Chromatiales bacterium]